MKIVIETTTDSGLEMTERMSREQFAARLVDHHVTHGKESLASWLTDHGLTFNTALELIGNEVIESAPDGEYLDSRLLNQQQSFSPIKLLLDMEKEYRELPAPSTDVESALQGHVTGDLRLKQLADNADSMSTDELERAMVDAGIQMPRSTLMR